MRNEELIPVALTKLSICNFEKKSVGQLLIPGLEMLREVWLVVCSTEKIKRAIFKYRFWIQFSSRGHYTMKLSGKNAIAYGNGH